MDRKREVGGSGEKQAEEGEGVLQGGEPPGCGAWSIRVRASGNLGSPGKHGKLDPHNSREIKTRENRVVGGQSRGEVEKLRSLDVRRFAAPSPFGPRPPRVYHCIIILVMFTNLRFTLLGSLLIWII